MEDIAQRRMARHPSAYKIFALLLTLCAWVPSWPVAATTPPGAEHAEMSPAASENDVIKKPLHDRNQYKFVKLPNGLRAILISVPDCDRAAACVAVHAGAHQDPEEVPGMAHLLEHLAFLGSKKYPEQSAFLDFVWTNGGTTNANTGQSTTRFFFEVRPDLLPEALDRLSQNLSSPLLEEGSITDEINAVDAEFQYRSTLDSRRLHMLLSHVPRLPHLGKFTTGNLDTLLHGPRSKGINLQEVIKNFRDTWYSANLMTLAVAGKESVDDLEEMVERYFSEIPNLDKAAPVVPQCSVNYLPFPPGVLDTVTYVVPVADLHQAVFAFYIPPTANLLDTKPELFIEALLGHSCATCLEAKLKNEGLISSLLVRVSDSESCSTIEMVLNLTEKGSEHIERIGELIFLYIRYIAVNPVEEWRWKELHDLQEIAFNYQEQPSPADLVTSIATNLIYYPPAEVLRGSSYMYAYDKNLIASILDIMRPSNARILLVDKKYEPKCTKVLQGYPVKYVEEPISAATKQLWHNIDVMPSSEVCLNMQKENMALPGPNPFIPTDLSLLKPPPHASPYPELLTFTSDEICGDMACKIFFKQDTTFKVPKTSATLMLYYKSVESRVRDALFIGLVGACLEIILKQEMADAAYAGYSFSVKSGVENTSSMLRQVVRPNALVFHATGYSDKLPQVFKKGATVLTTSLGAGLWKQVFPVAAEGLRKSLRADVFARTPLRQTSDALAHLLLSPSPDDAELVRYAEETTVTYEELESWLRLLQRTSAIAVEGLIQGNIDSSKAKEMVNGVLDVLRVRAPKPYHEVCQYTVFDMHNVVPLIQTTPGHQSSPVHKDTSSIQLRHDIKNILSTDKQNAVTLYIQMGWPSLQRRALILLATLWLRQKFFTELRTQQQLGYIVAFSTQTLEHSRYFLLTVTSVHHVDEVSKSIKEFLRVHSETPLSQEDFEKIQQAGIELNKVKHKSLNAEFAFNLDQLVMHEYMFDIKDQLCQMLNILTVEDLNKFLSKDMVKSPQILIAVHAQNGDTQNAYPRLDFNRAGQWIPIPKTALSVP